VATEAGYEMLYRRLTNQPRVVVPPVRNEIVRLPPAPRKSSFFPTPPSALRAVSLADVAQFDPKLRSLVDSVANDPDRWKWEREAVRVHEIISNLVEGKD